MVIEDWLKQLMELFLNKDLLFPIAPPSLWFCCPYVEQLCPDGVWHRILTGSFGLKLLIDVTRYNCIEQQITQDYVFVIYLITIYSIGINIEFFQSVHISSLFFVWGTLITSIVTIKRLLSRRYSPKIVLLLSVLKSLKCPFYIW